jgi:hypothetical protein
MPMGSKSKKAAEENQQALQLKLKDFLAKASELKPTISDPAAFDLLLKAVEESTQKNESNAQFISRLSDAGKSVKNLATTLGLIL